MFLYKYLGMFKKSEAEWVLAVLDMHDGDEEKSKQAITDALHRLTNNAEPNAELKEFDDAVAAAFFASRNWWQIGKERLQELGLFPNASPTPTA